MKNRKVTPNSGFFVDFLYMGMDAEAFWKRVNGLIKSQKTKQSVIAEKINVQYDTFRRWSYKRLIPGGDETYLIAQALGTTVEYLFTGLEPISSDTGEVLNKFQAVIDEYRKVSS